MSKTECLSIAGFNKFPDNIKKVAPIGDVSQWLAGCRIPDALAYYGLSDDAKFMRLFDDAWQRVTRDEKLQHAIHVVASYLFDISLPPAWDCFDRVCIDMLPAVVILSGWQTHMKNMSAKKFDPAQIEFNRREMVTSLTKGIRVYNRPGVMMSQMIWASILVRADLIRLGRLQYETRTAQPADVCPYIRLGDAVINIHIPRGAPLTPDSVSDSIAMARRHFGAGRFICDSWLLGPELGAYLKPDSNIANFRRRFHVIKPQHEESVYKFLFNATDAAPRIADLPADTSLRKSVRAALASGVRFHDAVGVLRDITR